MIWLSPAFPVGSFAYSHALEWVVETGAIRDLETAKEWLAGLIAHGGLRNDAILLAQAWHATRAQDDKALIETNALAMALAGSRERYLETTAQGNAFRVAIAAAWTSGGANPLSGDVAYPVSVGHAASTHGMALTATLEAFGTAAVANLTSALVRLNAIGQTDGQRVLAALLPDVVTLAAFAAAATLDDLGGCAFASDIASLRHETQYTRLFRT